MTKDPYRYFRIEARELVEGLAQGVLRLERGPVDGEVVSRLLRLAHTLKGAARVVKQAAIAELAHELEGILAPHRERREPLPPGRSAELLAMVDQMTTRLDALGMPPARAVPATAPARSEEPLQTVRIQIEEMEALHRGVVQAGVEIGAARRELEALDGLDGLAGLLAGPVAEELRVGLARSRRALSAGLERVDAELAQVRDAAYRIRLVPASAVFASLGRAVRDAAHSLGRRVEFEATGGEVRLDASVLAAMRDALLHVTRNAVAHGIEAEAARVSAGKPATGVVRVEVARIGSHVVFTCGDDGRGFDVDAVRAAATARGLTGASEAAALDDDEVLRLLLEGGITTQREVTELSGRGIGLDVVRETVARLKGEVRIRTERGRGARVELRVPVSIASLTTLLVDASGVLAAIPLDAVRATIRVHEDELARSPERDAVLHEGKVIPFLPLARALRRAEPVSRGRRVWSAVVLQAGDRFAAIGVPRCLGTATVVMRALPAVVDADPVVAGASLDAEGNPQLVLDPEALIARAEGDRGTVAETGPVPRPPVLVIDDSLTSRMLEQSILESAGYDVEVAASGEEGLARARQRRFGLFIVDVEMPGMDGFELVTLTRADPALRDTPAILVTSRSAPEDRLRGERAGAYAYMVKSEFDQGRLLQIIRSLIG